MLETWNRVTDKYVTIDANKIWGTHIGLEDQIPTIKLQNWLGLVAKLELLRPSL
jgi:hypothetical protein